MTVLSVFTHWHLYALIAIGYISLTLNQLALSTGALAPAIATSMAFDPIASVVIGVTLLQETIHESPLGVAATVRRPARGPGRDRDPLAHSGSPAGRQTARRSRARRRPRGRRARRS